MAAAGAPSYVEDSLPEASANQQAPPASERPPASASLGLHPATPLTVRHPLTVLHLLTMIHPLTVLHLLRRGARPGRDAPWLPTYHPLPGEGRDRGEMRTLLASLLTAVEAVERGEAPDQASLDLDGELIVRS